MKDWMRAHGRATTIILWVVAIAITSTYLFYENDPYDPLSGSLTLDDGSKVEYELTRSSVIGRDLDVGVKAPEGTLGFVEYRRVNSTDEPQKADMALKDVKVGHGGDTEKQLAATLPSLKEMAGKYAYTINLQYGGKTYTIDDGRGNPVMPRYRGDVPAWVLIPHIIFIMLSMLLGIRAALETVRPDAKPRVLMWATIATLLLGGFVFGPLMQKYAFGVYWAGIPMGWDLTDNKVTVELVLWAVAAFLNTGSRRDGRWANASIAAAGIATFAIYMIPHSLLGSGYDYSKGGSVIQ